MKLLIDENQVAITTPGGESAQYCIARTGFTDEREMKAVAGMVNKGGPPIIGFPNLQSCQGVVAVMEDGSMIGTHVPSKQNEAMLMAKMKELVDEHGGADNIKQLYVAFNSQVRQEEHGLDTAGKAEMLGFRGEAKYVDTAKLKLENEGAYAQFSSLGRPDGKCLIEGKRESKMAYESKPHKLADAGGRVRDAFIKDVAKLDTGATVMHELKGKSVHI